MNAALVLTALFNGAWQGAVLCGLGLLVFRFFRRLNATTMFTVWSVLLAIAVLLPFLNYFFAPKAYVVAPTVQRTVATQRVTTQRVTVLHIAVLPRKTERFVRDTAAVQPAAPAPSRFAQAESALAPALAFVFRYAYVLLLVLGAVAIARLAILIRDVLRMLVARERVRPIDAPVALSGQIGRPYRFAASDDFTSPCVLGFAPALIVIPEDLLAEGSTELTSVVLHEREHVRRFDDVQNVIQRFIGAIAFFCPGVRIAIRELALYREQICDDAAVNATGDRISYAMTLTDLAQWAQGRGTPVPSLIFKRKHLMHRLEMLLDSAVNHSMRTNARFALAAATALVIAAALVLRVQVPVFAESEAKAPKAPASVAHAPRAHAPKPPAAAAHVPARAPKAPVIAAHPPKPASAPKSPAVHAHTSAAKAPKAPPSIPQGDKKHSATRHAGTPVADADAQPYSVAYAYSYRQGDAAKTVVAAPAIPQGLTLRDSSASGDLLDSLNAAGMRNLSVDDLITLRDHGVTGDLVRSAASYFGRIPASDLTYLADHGVTSNYIGALRQSGVGGITPAQAVKLMDHGVTAPMLRAAYGYFSVRPDADELASLVDHGVGASFIDSLRRNGVTVCWQESIRMVDNGIDAAYVAKVRRTNPRASIEDIIKLRNAGF